MTDDFDLKGLFPLDESGGPARRISAKAQSALIESVLDQWQAQPVAPPSAPPESPEPSVVAQAPRPRAPFVVSAVIGGVLLFGGGAALLSSRGASPSAPASVVAPTPAPVAVPVVAPVEAVAPVVAPAEPEPVAPIAPRVAPRRAAARATPAAERAIADLLEQANGARRRAAWREAEQLYARAAREYPGTDAARTAAVGAADLRLGRLGDPAGALRLYRGAVGDGALDEEARLGVAESLLRLGRRHEARAAYEALLEAHPGGLAADRARQRLVELGE